MINKRIGAMLDGPGPPKHGRDKLHGIFRLPNITALHMADDGPAKKRQGQSEKEGKNQTVLKDGERTGRWLFLACGCKLRTDTITLYTYSSMQSP
jgi:hypothetical protein